MRPLGPRQRKLLLHILDAGGSLKSGRDEDGKYLYAVFNRLEKRGLIKRIEIWREPGRDFTLTNEGYEKAVVLKRYTGLREAIR